MNRIVLILIGLTMVMAGCQSGDSHSHAAMKQEIAELKAQLEAAESSPAPGLIHNVYFWLKEDISAEEKATFMAGARSLGDIESVQAFYMGPHADTEARDVVDHSYDLALVIMFEDQADQDAYQVDQIHLDFIEASSGVWTEVKVYDVAIE